MSIVTSATIRYKASKILTTATAFNTQSPLCNKLNLLIKRDDLLELKLSNINTTINGNKGRKFYNLNEELSKKQIKTVISYGGSQSNSMLAIAKICRNYDVNFTYYTKKLSEIVKKTTSGSFYDCRAKYKMNVVELERDNYSVLESAPHAYFNLSLNDNCSSNPHGSSNNSSVLLIEQGGSYIGAKQGATLLAQEIVDDILAQPASSSVSSSKVMTWKILIASGTGTTALFVHQGIRDILLKNNHFSNTLDIEVIAVPVIGDELYLFNQMQKLHRKCTTGNDENEKNLYPTIISDSRKRSFGLKVYLDHYNIWKRLRSDVKDVEFDLLYAPRAFEIIYYYLQNNKHQYNPDDNFMYYHCGGVEGNESMMPRYQRMIDGFGSR